MHRSGTEDQLSKKDPAVPDLPAVFTVKDASCASYNNYHRNLCPASRFYDCPGSTLLSNSSVWFHGVREGKAQLPRE